MFRPHGGKDAVSNGSPAAADATIADGVPALPADTIGASRGSRPKESDRDWETPPSKAAEQSSADDSPAFSFGAPPSAAAWSASAAADPAESAAKPSGDDASPTAPSRLRCALGYGAFAYGAFWAPVAERLGGAGRTAVRLPGRVRVGDA